MPKKITPAEAKRILSTVRPQKSFWVNNGPIVNNLKTLPKIINEMNDAQFMYHVNKDKNDFSDWIRDILGDKKLSNELRKCKIKKTFIDVLKKRIEELRKTSQNAKEA